MLPDYFQTEIYPLGYFTFQLPGTALGIDSGIILEISVEYGLGADGQQITANAWAREQSGVIKYFLQTVHVALGGEEAVRIIQALNSDEIFQSNAVRLIAMLEQQK